MKYRHRVLALLGLAGIITYLDRACIAVAGPRMQQDLHISPAAWGWVAGVFFFAYSVFEIPTGALADRLGPRKVMTRIVLWWSAFTSLTGTVFRYWTLLAIRFFFGVGEAGAFPNFTACISRWFPRIERARALGLVIMACQIGGALSPLLVVPIQIRYGWRASFFLFGVFGVLWAVTWSLWYRDFPSLMKNVSQEEIDEIGPQPAQVHDSLSWKIALRSGNLWCHMLMAFGYFYAGAFFFSWFPTYLVKAHGYSEKQLLLSTLPFVLGACGNASGGFLSDTLVRKWGLKWGRRSAGMFGAGVSAVALVAAMLTSSKLLALIFLSLTYVGVTLIQPTAFAVCIDIARKYAGAVSGAMNTAAQAGGFLSSIVFGYLVRISGSYEIPLIPMVLMAALSALLWLKIDPTKQLIPENEPAMAGRP